MTDKLASLDFSTPNNACLSLRTLAEWVRTGDVAVRAVVGGGQLKLAAFEPLQASIKDGG